MSGIVGIYRRHEEQVRTEQLNLMVDAIAHRGVDGSKVWQQQNVGFGHLMLHTTPESLVEELPYCDSARDTVITADARIDNRHELIDLLNLQSECGAKATDSSLILKAYHKWGTDCVQHLLGDFAFAIWDSDKQHLFCARDHFGIKPFYYYTAGSVFVFASEIKAILSLPEVPRELDEDKVADYVIGDFDNLARTFYQGILRLPAGHCLTITAEDLNLNCYWSLDIARETILESDEAYAAEFQRLFTQAVECRLRSALPVGSELSGGLDSSAVSCVAKNLLTNADESAVLPTFSAVFDNLPECDESEYIEEVTDLGGFEPHYMQGDDRTPITDVKDIFWYQDEAFFGPGFAAMTWGICKLANHNNIRVLLNGHDGDSTVSHGFGYLHDLARENRWLALYFELQGVAKIYGESALRGFWKYFSGYTTKKAIARYKYAKLLFKAVRKAGKWLNLSKQVPEQSNFIDNFAPEFAQRSSLSERYYRSLKIGRDSQTSSKKHHYRLLTQGLHALALEIDDKAAAAFGMEMRYPFWDKRLVEFCLSLPADQKLARGWSRVVMRRGMAGILPPKVQWRTSKMDFTPNFKQGLLVQERQSLQKLLEHESEILERYVDLKKVKQKYERGKDLQLVWKIISLGLWLNYTEPKFNSKFNSKSEDLSIYQSTK